MIKKLGFLLLTIFVSTVYADDNISNVNYIKQNMAKLIEKYQVPGVAVEVLQDGKSVSYYFGQANLEKKTPVNKNTIFDLGPLTELLTSILFAQELDAARMQLNAPVNKYMPALTADDFDDMTMQSLATYTSGLPVDAPANVTSQAELENYLNHWYPDYVTDEQWINSPLSIGVLGYVLEQQTKQKLDDLYRRRILSPLGMQPIGTHVPAKLQAYYAQGYNQEGVPVATPASVLPAAVSVKASAMDMQRFLVAAIGLPGTPENILYPMRMTQANYVKLSARKQGLGWEIYALDSEELAAKNVHSASERVAEVYKKAIFKNNDLLEKSGSTDGFSAYIALIPGKKTGIVILMNKHVNNDDVISVGREILFNLAEIHIEMSKNTNETTN